MGILARQQTGGQEGTGATQGGGGQVVEGRRVARPRMRGFTLGGFRFRFGIVFHTVHQVPQVQGGAANTTPPPAQTEGGDSPTVSSAASTAAPATETTAEDTEVEVDNVQLRRYVAEVSASAMAVEQLADEGEEVLEEDPVIDTNEEGTETSSLSDTHCDEKGESYGQSSQKRDSQKLKQDSEPKRVRSEESGDGETTNNTDLRACGSEDKLETPLTESSSVVPPTVSLTTSDIQDVRQNLVAASH